MSAKSDANKQEFVSVVRSVVMQNVRQWRLEQARLEKEQKNSAFHTRLSLIKGEGLVRLGEVMPARNRK